MTSPTFSRAMYDGAVSARAVCRKAISFTTRSPKRTKLTFLSAAVGAMAILATGGMAVGPPYEPVRMSNLNAEKTAGYDVFDRYGAKVGKIASVENADDRTMWINVAMDEGGTARIASFRAFLDAQTKEVGLVLTQDLVTQRAYEQANQAADDAAFKAVMENGEADTVSDKIAALPKAST
jgi:hypothetical protein